MPKVVFIDWESAYDTKGGYTLSGKNGLSMVEYVRDPRFTPFGFSWTTGDKAVEWVSANYAATWLASVDWSDVTVVAHNCKFDGLILRQHYGIQPKSWLCTKAMSHAVLGKTVKSHSLGALATYFELPSKGMMKTDGLRELTEAQEAELAEYGKHDTWLCREIYKKLRPRLPENQDAALSWTVDTFVNPKLVLDVPALRHAAAAEIVDKRRKFRALGIDGAVFRSNDKFANLLAARGYEVPQKKSPKQTNEDGTPKLIPAIALGDAAFVEMLESPDEDLRILAEARKAAKSNIIETRSQRLAAIGRTGTWPFDVEFSGATQTQRFSGGAGAGGNPQNFTKGSVLRSAVGASEGYSLVVGDMSQIEARFVAYLSKDPELIRIIEKEPDLYCDYGSRLYGRVITRADKEERAFAKEGVLGLGYNMGPKKFAIRVKLKVGKVITPEEAYAAVMLYRETYAGVPRLWKMLDEFIVHMTDGGTGQLAHLPLRYGANHLILPSGLWMQYPNLRQEQEEGSEYTEWVYDVFDKGTPRKAKLYGGKLLENICQALAGEFCKEVLVQFADVCTGQVHDELHLLVPTGLAPMYARRLQMALSTPPSWLPQIKLEAEVRIAKTWGAAK